MPIQWIIIGFAIFAVFRAWRSYLAGNLDKRWLMVWVLLWLAIGGAILSPGTTSFLANVLGVGRGADLALYLSVVIMFYFIFLLVQRVDKLERTLTELVRLLALHDARRDDNKK